MKTSLFLLLHDGKWRHPNDHWCISLTREIRCCQRHLPEADIFHTFRHFLKPKFGKQISFVHQWLMVGTISYKTKHVCVIDNSQEMLLRKNGIKVKKKILKTFSNLSLTLNFTFYVLLITFLITNISLLYLTSFYLSINIF